MNPGTLFWSAQRCTAAQALAMTPGEVVVFAATPTHFIVGARWNGWLSAPGHVQWTVPADCFQFTAFDPEIQLRWLADGDEGTAVWLTESQGLLPRPTSGSLNYLERLPQRAILWGRPDPASRQDPFSAWSQARIGRAYYPCPPGADPADRAALKMVEYISVDDHGNAAVVDVRFISITVVKGPAS